MNLHRGIAPTSKTVSQHNGWHDRLCCIGGEQGYCCWCAGRHPTLHAQSRNVAWGTISGLVASTMPVVHVARGDACCKKATATPTTTTAIDTAPRTRQKRAFRRVRVCVCVRAQPSIATACSVNNWVSVPNQSIPSMTEGKGLALGNLRACCVP